MVGVAEEHHHRHAGNLTKPPINPPINPLERRVDSELSKLRIDKSLKSTAQPRAKWPLVLLVVLLIFGVAAGGWYFRTGGSSAPVVEVLRIRMPEGASMESDLVALNATGYIVAARKIEVASKVVGRVAWVGVERGDKVEKGQVLVRLEDEEYKARVVQQDGVLLSAQARLAELEAGSRIEEVAQFVAQVDQAQVDLDIAELNLKRFQELMPTKAISRQQLDDADSVVRSRRAQLELARQRLNLVKAGARKEQIDAQRAVVRQMEGGLTLANVDLASTIISAPVDGTILQRNVEVGEFVTTGLAGAGGKGFVVSLADLDDLEVELDISQNDFAKVKMNQPAWVTTDAYPDKRYDGVISLISPEANRQKATVEVRVKVKNPDGLLKPDMNATVSFLRADRLEAARAAATRPAAERPALRIPASAIRNGEVLVVIDGKAQKRTLVLGDTIGGNVEVRKGLTPGEDVILNPGELKPNDPVRLPAQ